MLASLHKRSRIKRSSACVKETILKNNNMARRSERGSHTKCGVLVCGVGQAFWLKEFHKAKKLTVCAIIVVVFVC